MRTCQRVWVIAAIGVCSLTGSVWGFAAETTEAGVHEPQENVEVGQPPREKVLDIDHVFGGRYGPWGFAYQIGAQHNWMFFPESQNRVLNQAHVGLGADVQWSPSFITYGPTLTIAPLTIFKVQLAFSHVIIGYWQKEHGILDYTDLGQFADYSYSYRAKHGDELGQRSYKAWSFNIKPTFQIKFDWFVFVYRGDYMYFKPGDFEGIYYNYIVSVTLSHKSWFLKHDVFALGEIRSLEEDGYGVLLGINSTFKNMIDDGGATDFVDAWEWRIGPAVLWTITKQVGSLPIYEPTAALMVQYYAHDAIADPDDKRIVCVTAGLLWNTDWYR